MESPADMITIDGTVPRDISCLRGTQTAYMIRFVVALWNWLLT